MAATKATIGLTPKAKSICEDLCERLEFKDLAHVRDIAIAHAIRLGLEVKRATGTKTVWASANASDDLVAILKVVYPDAAEKDVYALYQDLANLGLESLGKDKNYKHWEEINDLPGLDVETLDV
jgi:hypothetical protein